MPDRPLKKVSDPLKIPSHRDASAGPATVGNLVQPDAGTTIGIQPALTAEAGEIYDFLQPFVDEGHLLQRTIDEIIHLTRHAFVAREGDRILGFAAVEVYSRKLAEIQCLSVSPEHQRMGIGRRLVERCIERAAEQNVLELMAITASDDFLRSCGFDYSLPSQKRALFVQPRDFVAEASGE